MCLRLRVLVLFALGGCATNNGPKSAEPGGNTSDTYMPDPSLEELATTPTAEAHEGKVWIKVLFCVDPTTGHTTDVKAAEPSDDPLLDEICVKTVESWFMPPPKKEGMCSFVVFNLDFP